MFGSRMAALTPVVAAGVGAGAALGFVNRAAHVADWNSRVMLGALGLLAAWTSVRLAARRPDSSPSSLVETASAFVLGVLYLAAVYLDGEVLWSGGAWIAAAGSVAAFRGAGGRQGKLRVPVALSVGIAAAGVLLTRFGFWNAAVVVAALVVLAVAAVLDGRSSRIPLECREDSGSVPDLSRGQTVRS